MIGNCAVWNYFYTFEYFLKIWINGLLVMKAKKIVGFALILGLGFGCVKHEVVPAPINSVELKTHFNGTINGTDIEFTDDVDGFNGTDSQDINILAGTSNKSSVKYYCDMNSNLNSNSMKVGIGKILFDASAVEKPTLNEFNDFFAAKTSTDVYFSDLADDGFIVYYRDSYGNTWTSKQNSVNTQSVKFTKITNQSDDTGDYSLFSVDFSCHVYRTKSVTPLEIDSLRIDNATMEGWFKR